MNDDAAGRPGILWFVLDEDSRERLRRAVPPMYSKQWYHHITLLYGVERSAAEEFIGKPWAIEAYASAHNRQAQACRVNANGLPDTYGVPHVTLSTATGVAPFAAAAMLKGEHDEQPLDSPIRLTGQLEFIYIDEIRE